MKLLNQSESLPEQVFEVLKRRGPQCQSQLSARLLVGTPKIAAALRELERMGVAEHRPEHDKALREAEIPWGLSIPHFS